MPILEKKKTNMKNITINVPYLVVNDIKILQDHNFEANFSEFARRAIRKLLLKDLKLLSDLDLQEFENSVREARGEIVG